MAENRQISWTSAATQSWNRAHRHSRIMIILIKKDPMVLVQGITGQAGRFHAERMLEYGTKLVAGVTPGKGGTTHQGVPVFDSVLDAVTNLKANASVIYVPAAFAADAVMEAAEAG